MLYTYVWPPLVRMICTICRKTASHTATKSSSSFAEVAAAAFERGKTALLVIKVHYGKASHQPASQSSSQLIQMQFHLASIHLFHSEAPSR